MGTARRYVKAGFMIFPGRKTAKQLSNRCQEHHTELDYQHACGICIRRAPVGGSQALITTLIEDLRGGSRTYC
jgi:hypothetical protein